MNDVSIIGRITDEPTPRKTATGKTVLNFVIAVPNGSETAFVDCVAWQGIATLISENCQKGTNIAISGALKTEWYEDAAKIKRKATAVVLSQITLL